MKHDVILHDVAKAANVSIATVSNVVNGKGRVSKTTMKRVQQAIEQLGYAPNLLARHLKTNQSRLIGLVVQTTKPGRIQDNPFYWDLLAGAEEIARDHGFHMILVSMGMPEETLDFVKQRQLDGLLVVGITDHRGEDALFRTLDIPCVYIDSYLNDPRLCQVCVDDQYGGYAATKHLLALGHRRIALLIGDIPMDQLHRYAVLQQRWFGYRKALDEAGLPYDPGLMIRLPTSVQGGYHAAAWLASHNDVSAIFSMSDIAALGLMKGIKDMGWRVPEQVSLVGFDNLFMSGYTLPALTTVSQNIVQKGRVAVKLLMELMDNKCSTSRKVVLPVELLVRDTTTKAHLTDRQ
ncbi:LacI family DNA-binding transcriptional regulator [Paenibacillus campinasensis]|uniref:LacI family DNA-binding transcriptional regulator n=1 Tax=Paenibacillus campinasensis TaxID=66347 RepID=A0ABW9T4T7_9BACL|nr:LacI family DNA-binding transcriptional regulator [Paenibacillus campinasensis]MUG67692.1 LacI family DNA-binding transcriptional regulator [Paenibacillus campinasensis]